MLFRSQSLISTPAEVERAARRAAELEAIITAAGGIAGPGTLGTVTDEGVVQ